MLDGIGGKRLSSKETFGLNVHRYIFKASSRAFSFFSYAGGFEKCYWRREVKRLKTLGEC